MRRILHISDLHFGRTDPEVVSAFLAGVPALHADLVVVSGDLTQRATAAQFAEARAFLERLAPPLLVVPGNHDISLWNVARRFFLPYERYRRYIQADLEPAYEDDEILVVGVNTACPSAWKEGRIAKPQIAHLKQRLSGEVAPTARAPASSAPGSVAALSPRAAVTGATVVPRRLKALVTHHPLVAPAAGGGRPVTHASRTLAELEPCGLDLVLAGHLHESSSDAVAAHRTADHRIVVVQAGTTLSRRTRNEANSFNLIEVDGDHLAVSVHPWSVTARAFVPAPPRRYMRSGAVWRRDEPDS